MKRGDQEIECSTDTWSAVRRWLLEWNGHLHRRKGARTEGGDVGFGSRVEYNEGWVAFLEKNPAYKETDDLMQYLVFGWLHRYFPALYRAVYEHLLLPANPEGHVLDLRERAYNGRKDVVLMREIEALDDATDLIGWSLERMGHDPQVPGDDTDLTGLTPKQRKKKVREKFGELKRRNLTDKAAVHRVAKECAVSVPRVYVHTRDLRTETEKEEVAC